MPEPWRPVRISDKGLPNWTLDTVKEAYLIAFKNTKGRRPWMECLTCEAKRPPNKLYYCEGCTREGVWDRARYCGRTCQKKDWYNHKPLCSKATNLYNNFKGNDMERMFHCMRTRQFRRRYIALKGTGLQHPIEWAARQAFLHCGIENTRDTQLEFFMVPMKNKPPDSLLCVYMPGPFTFKKMPWDPTWPETDRRVGQYAFDSKEGVRETGWVYLDDAGTDIYSPPCPQWPYVYAQCCFTEEFHPEVMRLRLEILLTSIRNFPDPNGILKPFIPPKFTHRWHITSNGFRDWMRIMGPVIGMLSG